MTQGRKVLSCFILLTSGFNPGLHLPVLQVQTRPTIPDQESYGLQRREKRKRAREGKS